MFSCTLRLGAHLRGALDMWRVIDGIVRAVLVVFVKNKSLIDEKYVLWQCGPYDCGKILCLHYHIIELFGDLIGKPLILSEEPEAFLIFYNLQNLKYLFSVASTSGSSIYHTPCWRITKTGHRTATPI